jgi:hypothetical protein
MSCTYKLLTTNYKCNLNVWTFHFSPYLSQILTELLKLLISLQRIKISIYVCNVCEVIFRLFGTVNFTIGSLCGATGSHPWEKVDV